MYIPIIMGVVFLFFGIKMLIKEILLRKTPYTIISGKVVGYEKMKRNGQRDHRFTDKPSYAPIFEYYYQGQTRRITHSFGTNMKTWLENKFPEGKDVELLVYQNASDTIVLNTKFGVNGQLYGSVLFSVIGIIVLIIGILINFFL